MNHFKSLDLDWEMSQPSASASSSGYQASSTFHATELRYVLVEDIQPRESASTHANRPQLPSKEQWEELKPLVKRLYIGEDRRLKDVLREIRRRKNFLITEKQMTTKLKEWNFRKNTTRTEREAVVLRGTSSSQLEQTMGGRKITGVKLERWQKTMKPGPKHSLMPDALSGGVQPKDTEDGVNMEIGLGSTSGLSLGPSSEIVHFTQLMEVDDSPAAHLSNSTKSDQELSSGAKSVAKDAWPFAPEVVDIIGSPKLSRLFAALKLECPADIDPLNLPEPALPAPPEVTSYLSAWDLMDLHNTYNGNHDRNDVNEAVRYEYRSTTPQFAFIQSRCSIKFPQFDVWFPSGAVINPSPFTEIYVFPSPTPKLIKDVPDHRTQIARDHFVEVESSKKLAKLTPLLQENDPRILKTINDLASACSNQGKYPQAEEWYRKLVTIRKVTDGIDSEMCLWAQLDLADTLLRLDKISEASKILQYVEQTIVSQFNAPHSLGLELLSAKAWVAGRTGDTQEEENCSRRLLQATLGTFGPRHPSTLFAMEELAIFLKENRGEEEAENLYRKMMQLFNEVNDVGDEFMVSGMWRLAEVLGFTNQQMESVTLSRLALERSQALLGVDHPNTFSCSHQLAGALRKIGRLRESEDLFREVVKILSGIFGDNHDETLYSINELGWTLHSGGRYGEAIECFQHVFWADLCSITPATYRAKRACNGLGLCYEKLGRYENAQELYLHYIDKIRITNGEAHPFIAKIEEWISDLPSPFNGAQRVGEKIFDMDEESL